MTRKIVLIISSLLLCLSLTAQSTFTSQLRAKAKKGDTVYGTVECDGRPLQGVAVSDGIEISVTDRQGVYHLASAKRMGYVFVSIPSGYEIETRDAIPQMWAELDRNAEKAERKDFSLRSVGSQDNHVLIAVTDIHIANKLDDIKQFKEIFMPRFREQVEKYRSQGIPVYSICMGDTSFDRFWYEYFFTIEDFIPLLHQVDYPVPMFHTTGNHDNDAATPQGDDMDFRSTERYRKAFGPTYYSFNIGKIHYIMIDNVYYLHKPVKKPDHRGLTGDHSYEAHMNDDEKVWLAKDLALVDRDTPIVVGMHCPALRYKGVGREVISKYYRNGKTSDADLNEFTEYFKDFREVHFITGHTHQNLICYGKDGSKEKFPYISNIIDHNITGVCGAWWMTQPFGGPSLDTGGCDAGFEVFPVKGKDIEWYFVSNDQGEQGQFRVYDMNCVRDTYRTCGEFRSILGFYPKTRTDYGKTEDNMIMVNVFAWDPHWELHIYEEGKELEWVQKMTESPLYTWAYWIPHASWAEKWKKSYAKDTKPKHFWAKASKADSTVEVVVKDTFGHEYRQTVKRPKPFTKKMY